MVMTRMDYQDKGHWSERGMGESVDRRLEN